MNIDKKILPLDDSVILASETLMSACHGRAYNIGMMTDKPFECHVSFALGAERATYLKIGNQVLVE